MQEQHREERALLRGADDDLLAVAAGPERAKQLELDLFARRGRSNVTPVPRAAKRPLYRSLYRGCP
jgi:hypothetical protein